MTPSVLVVLGTRPEAIKLAPVILELRRRGLPHRVLTTGQHRELTLGALAMFGIVPDLDLAIMRPGQTPSQVAAAVLAGLEPVLAAAPPDWMLIQGDTTTVLAAAIAAHYARIRVAHVEAGLRSHDRAHPFPEEFNRVLVSHAANLHLAPTALSREHLLREGIADWRIAVTGNPVVDALQLILARPTPPEAGALLDALPPGRRLILVTTHRRESFGAPLEGTCAALQQLAARPDVSILLPLHPNPAVRETLLARLGGQEAIHLCEALDYAALLSVMQQSHLVLTDSGGIQEEAPSLGKPVLVLRERTERPEGLTAGCARLVGTDPARIVAAVSELLDDPLAYAAMAQAQSPYGDGRAAGRIVDALTDFHDPGTSQKDEPTATASAAW